MTVIFLYCASCMTVTCSDDTLDPHHVLLGVELLDGITLALLEAVEVELEAEASVDVLAYLDFLLVLAELESEVVEVEWALLLLWKLAAISAVCLVLSGSHRQYYCAQTAFDSDACFSHYQLDINAEHGQLDPTDSCLTRQLDRT